MSEVLDLRGLSCPIPVMRVKNALRESPSALQALVDSPAARDNIARAVSGLGWTIRTDETDGGYLLTLEKT